MGCGRIGFDAQPGAGDSATAVDVPVDVLPGWHTTSGANAPAGRYWHTGVWTGTRYIVFGGTTTNNTSHTNTGGQYDPATDTWTATTTANAPMTRSWHSAVWTGSEMIVWGGRGPNNSGGRYDPAADSWAATTTTNAPGPRWSHAAAWTGTRMLVWGGYAPGPVFYNDGGQYDPIGDTWTPMTATGAPSARVEPFSVWTGSKLIVWGGCSGSDSICTGGTYPQDGGIYDPIANTWAPVTATGAPAGRKGGRAFWLGAVGKMLVWGGVIASGTDTNTGGLYDPATNTWLAMSTVNAPIARSSFSATWTGSSLLVWSGYGPGNAASTGGIYDQVADAWTAMDVIAAPPAAAEPLGPSTVWTGAQMIVWGGDGANSGESTGGLFAP